MLLHLPNQGSFYFLNRGAAAESHGQFEIFTQDIKDSLSSLFSIDGQAPNDRSSYPYRFRT
jgi:hypothetical protein